MSTHWLDEEIPRNGNPLSDVPGFMEQAPEESLAHRSSLDVVELQAYWPANAPGHIHTLVWYRYPGPLRRVVKVMYDSVPTAPGIPFITYAEGMLIKAGSTDAMRQGLIDVCSDGAIRTILASLSPNTMAATFEEEVKHLTRGGAFVFTGEVPPHIVNPFDFNIGGDA
jgi:hypothetical protein